MKERDYRSEYVTKRQKGDCVRCSQKALPGYSTCEFHLRLDRQRNRYKRGLISREEYLQQKLIRTPDSTDIRRAALSTLRYIIERSLNVGIDHQTIKELARQVVRSRQAEMQAAD